MPEQETAKITVEPIILEMQELQKKKLKITVDGDFTVSTSEYLSFDKPKRELTALKATTSPETLTFTKDDESVTIQVSVKKFEQENGLIVQKKEYTNKTNITEGYFSDVRLIEDGRDYVAAEDTNRPHKDTLQNISVLSSVEDIRGLHSTGDWNISEIYQKGTIVSFLSEYFTSLQDNNTGNIPKLSSEKDKDEFWKPICNITDVSVKDFSPKGRESMRTGAYYPFINGKNTSKESLKGGKTYTLYRMPKQLPFKENFCMYLEFDEPTLQNDSKYPAVSYIECSILYTGLKNNVNNILVPELRFGACHTSLLGRDLQLIYPANNELHGFDKYGPYGVSMQTRVRNDELVAITLTPKWDCEILFSGDYRMSPSATDETGSLGAVPFYTVNHLVRPNGGDSAQNLGETVIYFNQMTNKQIWDKGLINRMAARTLYSTEYTLLALAIGGLLNTGDTKPSGQDYNNTGAEITLNLPKLNDIQAGNILYTKAF